MGLRRLLKKVKARLWAFFVRRLPGNCQISHSQFGEDMILSWLFRHRRGKQGRFVDIGAYHPITFSNTFTLYCQGWRGINVEPRPGAMAEFEVYRPEDVNLRLCITPEKAENAVLYQFEQAIHNTIDESDARKSVAGGRKLVCTETIAAMTVNEVLEKYHPAGEAIDLFTIDVEGVDEAILLSLDWTRFTPMVLIFESREHSYEDVLKLGIVVKLAEVGYDVVAKCGESIIMRHCDQWRASLRNYKEIAD